MASITSHNIGATDTAAQWQTTTIFRGRVRVVNRNYILNPVTGIWHITREEITKTGITSSPQRPCTRRDLADLRRAIERENAK